MDWQAIFDLTPSKPVLMLALAALAFYIAARLGAAALDRGGANTAAAAAAHWLPIAAVVLVALKQQPLTSISLIFATTVACLSLVPGVTLLSAPFADDGAHLRIDPLEQPDRKAWAIVLPAALLALLVGFSGQFKLWHAGVFVIQGVVGLLLWTAPPTPRDPQHNASAQPVLPTDLTPRRAVSIIVLELIFWIGLTLIGAALAAAAVRDIPHRMPRLTGGTVAALMIAPALVLPLIGSSLSYVRGGHAGAVISTCVGVALLNLCVLLPLTIGAWQILSSAGGGHGTIGDFFRGDWLAPTQPLPYPMAVWRIDTVVLITIGAALVPMSAGRWIPRRLEGAAGIAVYVAYMVFSARQAIR